MGSNEKFDVSILIPTVGRSTLRNVIHQIEADSGNVSIQVIVIADGDDAMLRVTDLGIVGPTVKVVQNVNRRGVSGALNTGLQLSDGEYLMIFSDDDYWPQGKISRSLAEVKLSKNSCICFQVETINKAGKREVRPTNLPREPIDPLSYCYSSNPFLKNSSYLSLTSFISPKEVSRFLFPENLNSREDLAWLYLLYKNDFNILLREGVNARVEIGYNRTVSRDTNTELISWLEWLETNGSDVQRDFLYGHYLRPYVRSGKIFRGLYTLLQIKIWKYRPSLVNIKSILFLTIVGFANFLFISFVQDYISKFVRLLVSFIKLQIEPHRKRQGL
jgi:glycosyltransferase involved in cell wall biosynthesis